MIGHRARVGRARRVLVLAGKLTNKAEQPAAERSATKPTAAEPVEPRAGTKGNAGQQTIPWAQSQTSMPHALERIRRVANTLRRHTREVGAICGKAARTDLCEVTRVPTTTAALLRLLTAACGTQERPALTQLTAGIGGAADLAATEPHRSISSKPKQVDAPGGRSVSGALPREFVPWALSTETCSLPH
jgi:hypothetical protein